MCVGNEVRAKQSVCVSCPSLISTFPLSLFPPQTRFNYCPCSDLKPLWSLRTAPSPASIAAHTSSLLQTSPLLFCPLPLSFLVLPFYISLFFFIMFFLFLLILSIFQTHASILLFFISYYVSHLSTSHPRWSLYWSLIFNPVWMLRQTQWVWCQASERKILF